MKADRYKSSLKFRLFVQRKWMAVEMKTNIFPSLSVEKER